MIPSDSKEDHTTKLRSLARQVRDLRLDLRRTATESLLLCALEAARPLTTAETDRATYLGLEMSRLERDALRLRREFASLRESRAAGDRRLPQPSIVARAIHRSAGVQRPRTSRVNKHK